MAAGTRSRPTEVSLPPKSENVDLSPSVAAAVPIVTMVMAIRILRIYEIPARILRQVQLTIMSWLGLVVK